MKEKTESSSKAYYQNNKEKIKAKKKADRDNLTNSYVIQLIGKCTGLPSATIKKEHPESIKAKRALIPLRRALKN